MSKTTPTASMRRAPLACFDTITQIDTVAAPTYRTRAQRNDFDMAKSFLQAYTGFAIDSIDDREARLKIIGC